MPFEYCPQQQAHYFQHPYRRAQPSYCCYQGYFDICKKLFELALKLTIGTKWHKYEGGITVQIRSFLILVVCIFVIKIKKKQRTRDVQNNNFRFKKGLQLTFSSRWHRNSTLWSVQCTRNITKVRRVKYNEATGVTNHELFSVI